jgi:3-hydroxyisobutyrate dehydrogenase-like beta-hydroxyacid dehydrogenase
MRCAPGIFEGGGHEHGAGGAGAKGSADSFVLRNHGMKSLLPDTHPTHGAFPTSDIIKDLSSALERAESAGVTREQATTTKRRMVRTAKAGYRNSDYTVVIRTIAQR